ncbi:hypothetical protein [Pseudonocardia yuanmonensis]
MGDSLRPGTGRVRPGRIQRGVPGVLARVAGRRRTTNDGPGSAVTPPG